MKKAVFIKIIQFLIYVASLIFAFLNPGISPNWPLFLMMIGILLGNFIPRKYLPNFSKTEPSLYFKNRSRRLESIVEITFAYTILLLILFLNISS